MKLARPCHTGFAALLLASLLSTPGPARAADYVVLIEKERAGHLKVQSDGSRFTTDFSFRNNGRGPDLRESFEIGESGLPVRYSISGKSEMSFQGTRLRPAPLIDFFGPPAVGAELPAAPSGGSRDEPGYEP